MAIYESIPTLKLDNNELITPGDHLPELVHLHDDAKTVFIDFSKMPPATITPQTPIDLAIHEMKLHHQHMLLVEDNGQVVGVISFEDLISERPLRIMQEKAISRQEITVELLMQPRDQILAIDILSLRHAKVGHIINTIKENAAHYILVIKKQKNNKQLIRGLFSASQIGRQLHLDLFSALTKMPETIVELHKERSV